MRLRRFGGQYDLVSLGQRALHCDLGDGFLGILVLGLLRGPGFHAVHCVEHNRGDHKYQVMSSPHGSLGSGDKFHTLHYQHLPSKMSNTTL